MNNTSGQGHNSNGRLLIRAVEELRPHPSYTRHQLTVSASKLSALIEQGDFAFQEPLVISVDGTIIDGYARWQLALQQERRTVTCIQYELTEEEALLWLLHSHCRSDGLNQFCRILLAQELESPSRARALSNQKRGGRNKASSILTEAERVDVRSRIGARARASVGNVSKVQQLTTTAVPELLGALRNGRDQHQSRLVVEQALTTGAISGIGVGALQERHQKGYAHPCVPTHREKPVSRF